MAHEITQIPLRIANAAFFSRFKSNLRDSWWDELKDEANAAVCGFEAVAEEAELFLADPSCDTVAQRYRDRQTYLDAIQEAEIRAELAVPQHLVW